MEPTPETLTDAEKDVCAKIVSLMRDNRIPYGRAVFLFGAVTERLMDKMIKEGAEPQEALSVYMENFMAGMGVPFVMAQRHEVVDPGKAH